jgi:hypothetical protein
MSAPFPAPDPDPNDGPTLNAFRREALRGPAVVAYQAAEGHVVQAVGQLSSGREVAWLGPSGDTTHDFLDAIAQRFGAAAKARVHQELGLKPAPGKPLPSRLIEPALAIARRTHGVVAGLDFMSRLAFSAQLSGRSFLAACRQQGIDPQRLDAATRQRIDAAMAQRFAAAVDLPGNEVPQETAMKWLLDLLHELAPD